MLKSVDKAVHVGRADVAADDVISINKKVYIHFPVVIRVILDRIGIAHHTFFLKLRKVKTLRALKLVILREDLIKFLGNDHLLFFQWLDLDLPAELLDKVDPSLINPAAEIQKKGCVCNG